MPDTLVKLLRENSSILEKTMWGHLRNRRLNQYKFKRQVKIGSYIVDFINLKHGLIIEIDGSQHNEIETIQKDITRTKYLEKQGFKVIRFWNNELIHNHNGVIEKILNELQMLPGNYPRIKS